MATRLLALSLALAALLPAMAAPAVAQGAQGSATAAPAPPEWLDGAVEADFDGLTSAAIAGRFAIHQLVLQGSPYTAGDLRQAYAAAGMLGSQEAFLAGVEDALKARIEGNLRGLLPAGEASVVDVTIETDSLAPAEGSDPRQPPVQLRFAGAAVLDLAALGYEVAGRPLGESDLQTALDLGAQARLPYDLVANPGWNITFAFTFPMAVRLLDAEGGVLGADGRSATFALQNWRGASPLRLPAALHLAGRDAPASGPSDARLVLGIDLAGLEGLTIPGALRGDFGALRVNFDADVTVRQLRLEDFPQLAEQVRARLPEGLAIEALSADGFRLAVDRGLLPASALDEVEAYLQQLATDRTAALVPGGVPLEGGFAEGALDPAGISAPLDGDPPLAYRVHATFRIPLAPQASRMNAALGPVLYERELSFPVPRIEGLQTTYRLSLPQGIGISDVRAEGASIERVLEGGRDVLVVTPTADDAQATFTVAVTGEFVVTQFWYVFAAMFLLTALGIALALLRRRRRRRKAQALPAAPEPAPQAPAPEGAVTPAPPVSPDTPGAPGRT